MILVSPRRVTAALLLVLAIWFGIASRTAPSVAQQRGLVTAVGEVGITVADMDRSIDFYSRVLFFEKVSDIELAGGDIERLSGVSGARVRLVRMRLGDETIELNEFLTRRGRPVPVDSRSNDRWFQHIAIIVNDIDQAYVWLRRHRVQHVSPAPQRLPDWNPKAAGIRAFYFKDPDGHPLEVLQFPPEKGDARWQRPSDRIFLGIDHTAIVVSDTRASLAFYRGTLGMRVAGESENWGPEQERLNNVFGARLQITTLRAATGLAIELLEYLSPRDGRPQPMDARANDLSHWYTVVTTPSSQLAYQALLRGRYSLVSPSVVALEGAVPVPGMAFVARDPDGHALEFRADHAQAGR